MILNIAYKNLYALITMQMYINMKRNKRNQLQKDNQKEKYIKFLYIPL